MGRGESLFGLAWSARSGEERGETLFGLAWLDRGRGEREGVRLEWSANGAGVRLASNMVG